MRNTKKRILIQAPLLEELAGLATSGVPISRLIRNYNLHISSPILKKLITCYDMSWSHKDQLLRDTVRHSIFPDWLDNGNPIQTPPINWSYEGLFPFGYWVLHESQLKGEVG